MCGSWAVSPYQRDADVPRFASEPRIGCGVGAAGRGIDEVGAQAPVGIDRQLSVAADEALRIARESAEQPSLSTAGELPAEEEGVDVVHGERRITAGKANAAAVVGKHRLANDQ